MKYLRFMITFLAAIYFFSGGVAYPQTEIAQYIKKKVLVVYYSREGHTKKVAQKLAEKFDGDTEELIDLKKRVGPVAVSIAGKDATGKKLTKIKPLVKNPYDYDIILIGTPGWFSNVTPAVRTFVKKYDGLHKKTIGIFGTAHLSGIENALKQLTDLINKERKQDYPALALLHKDLKAGVLDEKITSFYEKIMKE